jgi:hypothetical protein
MPDIQGLVSRVDAEFSALREKHQKARAEQVRAYQGRQHRLQQLGQVFDRLREIWGPRLEVLVKKFGDEVRVTPRVIPSTREAKFQFQLRLARIALRLSASTDRDVTKVGAAAGGPGQEVRRRGPGHPARDSLDP